MNELSKTFAGGMSFATGAFIGAICIAYTMRQAGGIKAKHIIEANNRVEERLYEQVAVLKRIADHIERGGAK